MKTILLLPLLVTVACLTPLNAQMRITQTSNLVTLEPFDPSTFTSTRFKTFEPATVVLVNHSDRAIVAARVLWVSPNPNNPARPARTLLTTHIFMAPGLNPLMVPGSHTLVGPGTVIEMSGTGDGMTLAAGQKHPKHPGDASTAVSIDAVMFSDGELVGPDTDNLAGYLQAGKQAATIVADDLRAAGYAIGGLEHARNFRPTNAGEIQLANELQDKASQAEYFTTHGGDLRGFEKTMRALPTPPRAHRTERIDR
jgi:hypothetical protein